MCVYTSRSAACGRGLSTSALANDNTAKSEDGLNVYVFFFIRLELPRAGEGAKGVNIALRVLFFLCFVFFVSCGRGRQGRSTSHSVFCLLGLLSGYSTGLSISALANDNTDKAEDGLAPHILYV